MARHRKDYRGERLTAQVTVQLTAADRAALDEAVAELGLTHSAFSRTWIMKGVRATEAARAKLTAQREIDRRQSDELTRHGQVLNDLAHRANESQEITDAPAIAAVIELLTREIDRIEGLPAGGGRVSGERLMLMTEITRIGTNATQLMRIAGLRHRSETVALLDRFHDRIALCCERMVST